MNAPQSMTFVATPEVLKAFRKYGMDQEFNDFIESLQARAVVLAIMAIGQKDETVNRWLGGRAAELLEVVAAFEDRINLMNATESVGDSTADVPWPEESGGS